jgi:hypothetical protein
VQYTHEDHGNGERDLNQSLSLFKALPTSEPEYLRPPRVLVSFLWQKYLENVEPILKILHAPTSQRQILNNTEYGETLGTPTECLIFAICYAAVTTMTVEDCRVEFDEDKYEELKRYVSDLKPYIILLIYEDIAPELKAPSQKPTYRSQWTCVSCKPLSYTSYVMLKQEEV